jgi:23S rRNA (uracil1939-C5)-methyltransferase
LANQRGDHLTIEIESLAIGGRGVARHSSQEGRFVIFVDDTTPQDLVEVELTNVKKNFAEARLIKVVKPSPFRRSPACPVAGSCGGCSWQHVHYAEQLRQKRLLVEQNLQRISGFSLSEGLVNPVVPSPTEFRYRNRVQLHHQPGAPARMGFFKRGSHEIVDIDECLITEETITKELPRLKAEFADRAPGRIELFLDQTGRFTVREKGVKATTPQMADDLSTDSFVSPFSQVNTAQNRALVEFVVSTVRDFVTTASPRTIFDLYAGSGNFTFPLAEAVKVTHVIAVELSKESVLQARQKVAQRTDQNGSRIEFHQSDVGKFLRNLPAKELENSVVVLDPPRTGCEAEVIAAIAGAAPAFVVYISCHPVTLARDLKPLKNAGFQLLRVLPFDMFPQTDHIESAAVLKFAP